MTKRVTVQGFLRAISEREQADIAGPHEAEMSMEDVEVLRACLGEPRAMNPKFFGELFDVPIYADPTVAVGEIRWR